MVLHWKTEQQALSRMKQITDRAGRMDARQLRAYCGKLYQNREKILPGQLGDAFLLECRRISERGAAVPKTAWTDLAKEIDWLSNLIRAHSQSDEQEWRAVLPRLETGQGQYFKTGLGRAFVQTLKHKLRQTSGPQSRQKTADENQNLEQLASWLLTEDEDTKRQNKRLASVISQVRRAAVPALACLSLVFMAVWLRGQVIRNQNKWNIQQMKLTASQKAEALPAQNPQSKADFISKVRAGTDQQSGKRANAETSGSEKTRRHTQQETGKQTQAKAPEVLPQYQDLAKQYPQLYGWLQIPGLSIDLPVMQAGEDRDFYLHHDFTGAASAEGTLFVDQESSAYPRDDNTVIYGHNMKNGHIFGMLGRYQDADFFQEHKEIQFDTLYETGKYEAVAVLKTRILKETEPGFRYYQFFHYDTEKEFLQCRDFVEQNRLFETKASLEYKDQILMLSTCEYSQDNGRLVIVFRKTG